MNYPNFVVYILLNKYTLRCYEIYLSIEEWLEDNKEVIRCRKSKTDKQFDGHNKKDKDKQWTTTYHTEN